MRGVVFLGDRELELDAGWAGFVRRALSGVPFQARELSQHLPEGYPLEAGSECLRALEDEGLLQRVEETTHHPTRGVRFE